MLPVASAIDSVVEVVLVVSCELVLPLPEVLAQLLSQLLFVFGGKAIVEETDVDIRSRICSFPFFHHELAAKGRTLLLIAWFALSPWMLVLVLMLLFELLIPLSLQ